MGRWKRFRSAALRGALMMGGMALGLAATWMEVQRKTKAQQLAMTYRPQSDDRWT